MNYPPKEFTYDLSILEKNASIWEKSPELRCFYEDIYSEIALNCIDGPILEVGSGIAASRDFFSNLTTSDIVKTPYVDCAMSAYDLQTGNEGPWANIFAVDVLHHLKQPMLFFESAATVLCPGGRIILVEPAATLGGCAFYKLFHHEPIRPSKIKEPFDFESDGSNGEFANMGMGIGLFKHCRSQVDKLLKQYDLSCTVVNYRDLIAYPLTGGYSKSSALSTTSLKHILYLEKHIPQLLLRFLGLRMFVVIKKTETTRAI